MSTLTEDDLFLMVPLRGRSTGLNNTIWIGPRDHAQHTARIMVQTDHRARFDLDNLAMVSVADDPPQLIEGHLSAADLEQVRRYIALNHHAILDHWHARTDGIELVRALRPLPSISSATTGGHSECRRT